MQLEGNNSCVVAFEWQSFEEIDVKNLWEFSEIKMSIKKTKKEMEEEAKKKLDEMKKKKVKKLKQMIDPMAQSAEAEQAEIDALKADIEEEQKKHESMAWNNNELERAVRKMEANVLQLEAGNLEADDSPIKRKYDNQRQLNIQLVEQKKWLEHELEDVKLKQQNEKIRMVPDPFALDWDALSETEMKRLVQQLEATLIDIRYDLK